MPTTKLELVEKIRAASYPGRMTTLAAIDGCGGSGKSLLANSLADSLEYAYVVNCDDLSANPSHPEWRRRLMEQVVGPLLNDHPARYARYDWVTGKVLEWRDIEPGGVVIVEGVSTLHSDLGEPWDVAIWVECPRELRLARGVARDGEGLRSTWVDRWMPEEDEYVVAEQPQARADFIYDGSDEVGQIDKRSSAEL